MKSSIAPAMLALALALGALPLAASAQQVAYTIKAVNLRAGPDRYYPVVAVLPPSVSVAVYGCLSDYRWCDVGYGYDRGWVYAGNLRYPYQGGYVAFPGIAPIIGIAVLAFVIDDYWSIHYHDRPFYRDRPRYEARPRYPRPVPPHYLPPPPRPNVRPAPLPPPGHVPPPAVRPGRPAPQHGQPQYRQLPRPQPQDRPQSQPQDRPRPQQQQQHRPQPQGQEPQIRPRQPDARRQPRLERSPGRDEAPGQRDRP